MQRLKSHQTYSLVLAILIWLGLIGVGYAWLLRYSLSAGDSGTVPQILPADFRFSPGRTCPHLFLALHPQCPCSRATITELGAILAQAPDAGEVVVLSYAPSAEPDSCWDSPLVEECRRLGCRIERDIEGRLAASLGALTSGTVVLYDAERKLRYQGGITIARGHEGANTGARTVLEILRGHNDAYASRPVFGCPIQQPSSSSLSR